MTVGDDFTTTSAIATLTSDQSAALIPVVAAIYTIGWQTADGGNVVFWASHGGA